MVKCVCYEVDLRELMEGERGHKDENMNKDLENTVLKVAEYSNEEKKKLTKNINTLFIIDVIAITIYIILEYAGISDKIKALMLGISYGIMTVGVLYTSGSLIKIKKRIPSIIYKIKEGRIKDESS